MQRVRMPRHTRNVRMPNVLDMLNATGLRVWHTRDIVTCGIMDHWEGGHVVRPGV